MMSAETIIDLARQAAFQAMLCDAEPFNPMSEEEIETMKFRLPNLGLYRPDGWTLVDHVMADKTGMGASWEPALTIDQLIAWMIEKFQADDTAGFAMIEEGQFQAVVGYFSQAPGAEPDSEAAEGLGAEDFESEAYCEECGAVFEDRGEDECPECGADLRGQVFEEGETVTVPEPGALDDWPAGETWTVSETAYLGDDEITLADSNGDEYVFSFELVSRPYNPAEDPAQLALL